MSNICPDCGGSVEHGTCVCQMSLQIREGLKARFNLTDDELDAAFDEGRLYVSKCGYDMADNDDITVEEITCQRVEVYEGFSDWRSDLLKTVTTKTRKVSK